MTSENFAYWLNGFFELNGPLVKPMTVEQVDLIQRHLALVFKHDIDPKAGGPEVQAELNKIHNTTQTVISAWTVPGTAETLVRC